MYLYVRTSEAAPGKAAQAAAFAVEAAAYVKGATGHEIYTWTAAFGAPLGTVSWSARLESIAAYGEFTDHLAADAGFADLGVRAAELFSGSPSDSISEIVAGSPNAGPRAFAAVVTAQCAPGRIADAMTWGLDIMTTVGSVTGLPVMMLRSMYGPYAGIGWVTGAESFAEIDAGNAATGADQSFVGKLDLGGPLFLAGSAHQILLRRIG
jgi:hypothetical protein